MWNNNNYNPNQPSLVEQVVKLSLSNDTVTTDITQINARLDAIEANLLNVNSRLDNIDTSILDINTRLDNIDLNISGLNNAVSGLSTEVNFLFDRNQIVARVDVPPGVTNEIRAFDTQKSVYSITFYITNGTFSMRNPVDIFPFEATIASYKFNVAYSYSAENNESTFIYTAFNYNNNTEVNYKEILSDKIVFEFWVSGIYQYVADIDQYF
jgi:archaellum component FlaC